MSDDKHPSATNSNADEKGDNIMAKRQSAPDAPGMKGHRSRNASGPLREKRGDTHVKTIEKQYNVDFNVRSDMHLDTLLQKKGVASLNDLIRGN